MLNGIFTVCEWLAFILLAYSVLYLSFFSVAARFGKTLRFATARQKRKIVILIPAYREDQVIFDSVEACLCQDYEAGYFDVVVISDAMQPETDQRLKDIGAQVINMPRGENTKAKAMNRALDELYGYGIVVVLDADNVCAPGFLTTVNAAFETGCRALQAHRTAKNTDKPFALLDAASEEINNTIFRKGHCAVGLSSALIGSGMAFDFEWFKKCMKKVHSAGEDKEIEYHLLDDRIKIHYLENEWILDEKVSRPDNFYQQRRRWLSAQFYHLKEAMPALGKAIRTRNTDLINKLFQMFVFPRVLLLGMTVICTVLVALICPVASVKWIVLLLLLSAALFMGVPARFMNRHLLQALVHIPVAFWLMFLNLFRIKGANKKFIHTRHGDNKS